MNALELKHYLSLAFVVLLVLVSFVMIRPFLVALISAFVLAYLIRPLFLMLSQKLSARLAALACVALVILIIIIPLIIIGAAVVQQASSSMNSQSLLTLTQKLAQLPLMQKFELDIDTLTKTGLGLFLSLFSSALKYLPTLIIALFITIFSVYYFLIDWLRLTTKLKKFIPSHHKSTFAKDMAHVTNQLVYGTLLIAFIEFIVAAFGFSLAGLKYNILLAALIALFAFIPGPGIVWIPLVIILFVQNAYLAAIIALITGLAISIYVDTVLRITLVGKGTRIHPLVILLGIFGGVSLFGIFGFVIGPLILSYTLEIIEEIAAN